MTRRALAGFVGLVAALAVASGCKSKGKTTPDPPPDPVVPDAGVTGGGDTVDQLLAIMVEYRDRACACADEACIDAIRGEMKSWVEQHGDELSDIHPTEEQDRKGEQIMSEIDACQGKITGESPGEPIAVGEVLAEMESFRDQVCACADASCIEAAERGFMEWIMTRAGQLQGLKPSPDEEQRAAAIEKSLDDCKAKVTGGKP